MDGKMLAVVAAVALVSAMLGGYIMKEQAVETIRSAVPQCQAATTVPAPAAMQAVAKQQAAPSAAPTAPAPSTPSKRGVSGKLVFDEDIEFKSLPWSKEIVLEEGRYEVYFEADQAIKFVVYNEASFNGWKSSGIHTSAKVTTQFGPKCCETSKSYIVDINKGEGGKYVVLFDDSQLKLADARPTKAVAKIGKTGDM